MAKPSATTLAAAQSEIDTAVKKGLIKKNTAARRKSGLHKVAKEAGVKITKTKKPVAKTTTAKKPVAKKAPAKKPATKTATTAKKTATKKPAAKKA